MHDTCVCVRARARMIACAFILCVCVVSVVCGVCVERETEREWSSVSL